MTAVLLVLGIAGICYFNFARHFTPGYLDGDGMDVVQSARILARSGKFSTNIVRPLLTAKISVNGDGTSPDFGHPPLYPLLVAGLQRVTHQTKAGQGDREAILVSVALFVAVLGVSILLARQLFGSQPFSGRVTWIGTLFFALAGTAPAQSLQAHPAMLAAFLFSALVGCLFALDTRSSDPGVVPPPVSLPLSALAGALFGFFFLSLYSALLILPVILIHLYRINGGGRRALTCIGMFSILMLMVAGPLLARNERLAHNPLYNSRLGDLISNTESNPGYILLGMAVPPRSMSQYLSGGGALEIASKAGHNLAGYYAAAPVVLGLLVLPLFLLSSLTRFRDARVNRLRNTIFFCIACHILGLSPYQPFSEDAPALLIYAPIVGIIAAAFLVSLIQARNLPAFYANAAIIGWTTFACLPGIGQIIAPPSSASREQPFKVYGYLNETSEDMVTLRASGAYIMADAPWEAAFRLDVPVIWLPGDAADMEALTERTGRPIGGIVLTPNISRRSVRDPSVGLWVSMYRQIAAVAQVSTVLDTKLSKSVVEHTRLFYPAQLAAGMAGFKPEQVPERDKSEFSLLFWNHDAMTRPTSTPASISPESLLITP